MPKFLRRLFSQRSAFAAMGTVKVAPTRTPALWKSISQAIAANAGLRFSATLAIAVWCGWLILAGPQYAFSCLQDHWEVAVTMIFGSMVAGGTSMGGGAVGFPVLTKLLEVPPHEAKIFSLAIQSVGMSAASLTIIAMRTKVEWRIVRWASLGGLLGQVWGTMGLAAIVSPDLTRLSFTMMVASFAIALLVSGTQHSQRHPFVPRWSSRESLIAVGLGLVGGTISGLVGSGIDTFVFSVMVLLFRLCETIGTPTSVILMALNAIAGFALHAFVIGDFVPPVREYWIAAVPVVVVGAPVGAMLCTLLNRQAILTILLFLISVEVVSSLLLISLDVPLLLACASVLTLFSGFYYWISKVKTYAH